METAEEIRVDLIKDETMRELVTGFLSLLKQKLKNVEIEGEGFNYYTCGQAHNKNNPEWKPFKHLEKFCMKAGFYPPGVKHIIEEVIGRTISCECEIFSDPKELRRHRLQTAFGVDFGEPGKRDLDVV